MGATGATRVEVQRRTQHGGQGGQGEPPPTPPKNAIRVSTSDATAGAKGRAAEGDRHLARPDCCSSNTAARQEDQIARSGLTPAPPEKPASRSSLSADGPTAASR